jgi:hypothetical protein
MTIFKKNVFLLFYVQNEPGGAATLFWGKNTKKEDDETMFAAPQMHQKKQKLNNSIGNRDVPFINKTHTCIDESVSQTLLTLSFR